MIQLVFPTLESNSNGNRIVARGTARAECGSVITSMSALFEGTEFGIPIRPGPEVAWSATFDLAANQVNAIEIRATHSASLKGSVTFSVIQETSRSTEVDSAQGVLIHSETRTGYVVDRRQDRIVSFDLTTGVQSVFSGPGVGEGPGFENADGGIALDETRNQLVVTDRTVDAIFGVDLDSGDRRIISDNTLPDFEIRSPRGVVVDGPNARAYYSESTLDAVVEVDLLTGTRAVLSDDTRPAAPQPVNLGTPLGIVIDSAKNRILVVDSFLDALVEVRLADGARRVIGQSTTTVPFSVPRGLVLDGDRALVCDAGTDAIVSVDLREGSTLGDRTIVSSLEIGDGPRLAEPLDIALDTATRQIVVADRAYSRPLMIRLDPEASGDRRLLTELASIGDGPGLTSPTGLVIDLPSSALFVGDAGTGQIFSLDPEIGDRDSVLEPGRIEPLGLGFDPVKRLLFAPSALNEDLLSVTLDGEIEVISDENSPGNGNLSGTFALTGQVAVEPGRDSVLVSDRTRNRVHRIELSTGVRSDFSRSDKLDGVRSVIIDEANNRAIVSTGSRFITSVIDAVIAYDLTSGNETVLASTSTGAAPVGTGVDLTNPIGLAVDESNNALLVFDADLDAIVTIDLTTLERSILVDTSTGNGDHLSSPFNDRNAIALDPDRRLLYAVNDRAGEVVLVDLLSGDQVVIAR